MNKLRIAGVVPESVVDGPGIRLALFVQGCPHGCIGCHNPASHDPAGGSSISVSGLLARIRAACGIDGVTFTGGEPFAQAGPLARLARGIQLLGLNLVIYSGYTFEELLNKSRNDPDIRLLLTSGFLLVDGPFIEKEKDLALPFRGSRNQRLLDLPLSLRHETPVLWQGSL
ncbi:MAG: 4Fe-4S single cluster domain-containing protein [Bacillota bacterium]